MNLVAALLLLLSASDHFDAAPLAASWQPGLRGMPAHLAIVERDGDACLEISTADPAADDLVRTFPRPVTIAQRPVACAHVWLPPFEQWPTAPNGNGNFAWCAVRLTARDQYGRLVWPGIWLARDDAGTPCLRTRILAGLEVGRTLSQSGWWTLGLAWDAAGVLSFYAAPGRVALTADDVFATDRSPFPELFTAVEGWFLQVAAPTSGPNPAWTVGDVQLHAAIFPRLDITLQVSGGYPGQTWEAQRSADLSIWSSLSTGAADATLETTSDLPAEFFRLSFPQ